MSDLISQLIGKDNTRRFKYRGKVYKSFTTIPGPSNQYISVDSFSCDIKSFSTFCEIVPPYKEDFESYISSTLAQLLYNNWDVFKSYEELCQIYSLWIMQWRGNEKIKDPAKAQKHFIELQQSLTTYNQQDLIKLIIIGRTKKHWYPLDIELLQNWKTRKKSKAKIRGDFNAEQYREEIKTESDNFRNEYWGIYPLKPYLAARIGCSGTTIKKHGGEYYMDKKEQKLAFINKIRELSNGITQEEMVKILDKTPAKLKLRAVKEYWSKTKPT